MEKIAKFYKVSLERFNEDYSNLFPSEEAEKIEDIYEKIKLPKRATKGSAGYDFFSPIDFELDAGKTICIPTGIRVKIKEGWVLSVYPRSGLGFKFRMQLNNTVGIIDSDYFYSDNEGHIFIKFTNATNEGKTINIRQGNGIVQGIFLQYGITDDDECESIRNGGLGSTD